MLRASAAAQRLPGGPKDLSNPTRERVAAQIVDRVVTTRKINLYSYEGERNEEARPASIWPYRGVSMFPLHNYPLSPASRGAFSLLLLPL